MSAITRTIALLSAAFLVCPAMAVAQDDGGLPLFADDTTLSLKITGPFRELWRNRDDDETEYDASLEHVSAEGETEAIDIKLRLRGRSRRSVCTYPPLRLDFPKDDVGETIFTGQNRIKLVTLCKDSGTYERYLLKEFQIYRALNLLTDKSFRVRWVNVEYVYTDGRDDQILTAPAFLIEEEWEVADRAGLDVIETERLDLEDLDREHTALVTMFQYLIGNPDWSVLDAPGDEDCCHNGKVIGTAGGRYFVLPYDFDNSGLVNAEYAVPPQNLRIRSVRQRIYWGFCKLNNEVLATLARISGQRGEINRLFGTDFFDDREASSTTRYLDGFFEIVNDPRDLERQVYEDCRD